MHVRLNRRTALIGMCSIFLLSTAGVPVVAATNEEYPYLLGDTTITIKILKNGDGPTFVCPHDDETTASAVATAMVIAHGGVRVELSHTGRRNISFTHQGVMHTFDPNRMFSDAGIKASLEAQGGAYSEEVHQLVKAFASTFKLFFRRGLIVAVHNNTDGNYAIDSYAVGGGLQGEASDVHINPSMDKDDFFFVTTADHFRRLKERNFNVVLQASNASDDGSLSVYAARNGIQYINVEAQEGHVQFQQAMLEALL